MNKKIIFGRSIKDILLATSPVFLLVLAALVAVFVYVDPAPPTHLTIATGDRNSDYQAYAEQYREFLKEEGVTLEIRPTSGPAENLRLLEMKKGGVDVGFVPDGAGSSETSPDLLSLGSLFYEPLWVFSRRGFELARYSQLEGKRIAVGPGGGGTRLLAERLLALSGVTDRNATFSSLPEEAAADALGKGTVDAAFFMTTPSSPLVKRLVDDPALRLMSVDQAEGTTRRIRHLHHLTLPHGTLDLRNDRPERNVELLAPTATLLVRDDLHPALVFLLLKAATFVHSNSGILEKENEFPSDKDDEFPLSSDAKAFYKSGGPFWQRFLPFWIAAWVDRFILLAIPILAIAIPLMRLIPRLYNWRVRSRIFQRYGELKTLESKITAGAPASEYEAFLRQLDEIEERVNAMKVPLDFSDLLYVLREHVDFVRGRLRRIVDAAS